MEDEALAVHKAQLIELHRQIEGNRKAIDAAVDTLDALIDAAEGKAWLARIKEIRARYASSSARALDLMEEGRQSEAVALMNRETLPAVDALQGLIRRLLESQQKGVPVGRVEVKQQLDSALTLMTVLEGAPSAVWKSDSAGDF